MLELGITFDFAQFVMDNEIFKMIRKAVGGIRVTDADMAVDIIKEIGPGGEFISHAHTFENFRKEQSQSRLIDRTMRDTWLLSGGRDLTERAYEEANHILNTHKVAPLAPGTEGTIRSIVEEAEEEYGIKR
ncbi:trimethylamine methyltransferase [Candidatus Formimonas warabiya]|uniref:Trimethylamine methyltransferase n=1 Tax=Formimonas warabiya TaxID=1761012 RepID=A0A3G1L301_FORW1|nr:trimethylamine methyltransferase [Candidatus Formimonas warabiya]